MSNYFESSINWPFHIITNLSKLYLCMYWLKFKMIEMKLNEKIVYRFWRDSRAQATCPPTNFLFWHATLLTFIFLLTMRGEFVHIIVFLLGFFFRFCEFHTILWLQYLYINNIYQLTENIVISVQKWSQSIGN